MTYNPRPQNQNGKPKLLSKSFIVPELFTPSQRIDWLQDAMLIKRGKLTKLSSSCAANLLLQRSPLCRFLCDEPNKSQSSESSPSGDFLYLHVGPSGDFWTGPSLFAAKHLQPNYVKSIKLDETTIDADVLLELLEEKGEKWTQYIYDEGVFPQDLLDKLAAIPKDPS